MKYITHDDIDRKVSKDIADLIKKNISLSNEKMAVKLILYADSDINFQIKIWVLNHIDQGNCMKYIIVKYPITNE